MTEGQFLTMLRNRGVIPTTLIDQIRAQIASQGFVQLRVRPSVVIPPEEVEEVVTSLAAGRGSIERRAAEISIPAEPAATEADALANAHRLPAHPRRASKSSAPGRAPG